MINSNDKSPSKGPHRMSLGIRRLNNPTRPKRADSSNPSFGDNALAITDATLETLRKELTSLRKKFEIVRHSSIDDMELLRRQTEGWSIQASRAIASATAETDLLREKYAAESAMRLKLLNSLQDKIDQLVDDIYHSPLLPVIDVQVTSQLT